MKIFLFDNDTKIFLGESKAVPGDIPGSWFLPLNSTYIAPPEENRDEARWNGARWNVDIKA